jgi:hygromycin-B 7''-O-kinase
VATRLPGRPIDAIWDELDADVRIRLATRLGTAIRELHRRPCDTLAQATEPWPQFRRTQRARCRQAEADKGLAPDWLAQVDRYWPRLDEIPEATTMSSLLHTEIGPSHVLVDDHRITGLIDFGDARVGDPEYDLAPVGMFVTRGDAAAFRAFCVAYGLDAEHLADPDRPARLLRHALLHRYATLAWYLETLRPPAHSLDELAEYWFGVG